MGGGLLAGEGVPATQASMSSGHGDAFNSGACCTFLSLGPCSVRKIVGGSVTTVVGAAGRCSLPATAAYRENRAVDQPLDIAFDQHDNLYIVEGQGRRVPVDATGAIRALAGNGTSASLATARPRPGRCWGGGMCEGLMLASGGAYIADSGSHRVRLEPIR
jgi:hypothetical protein